jgi:Arc/MetJ-type ribon-helix-helix transcriptional regulator
MTIALTSEQLKWLETAVAAGRFESIEAAVQAALVGLMVDTDQSGEAEDDWVAPLLDEARASDARGESISLEEFKAYAANRRRRTG